MKDLNFNKLLFTRHSIRRYKDEPVQPDAVKQILEAGLLAPSSKSSRPWQFVVVEDKAVMAEMAKCRKIGTVPLKQAAFAVVVCADPEKSDVYIEDCAVAATCMQLQAAALEVGSCWVQIRNRYSEDEEPAQNMIQALLGIDPSLQIVTVLTFGISDEQRKPVDPDKLMWEKVHIGAWKRPE